MENPWSQRRRGVQHCSTRPLVWGYTWNPWSQMEWDVCHFLSSQNLPCSPSSFANDWARGAGYLLRKQEEVEEAWTVSCPVISRPLAWPTGMWPPQPSLPGPQYSRRGRVEGGAASPQRLTPSYVSRTKTVCQGYGVQISVAPGSPKAESVLLLQWSN